MNIIHTNINRMQLLSHLTPNGVGVELGVFRGDYSKAILDHSSLKILYSIDRWAGDRGHDDNEYNLALSKLSPYKDRCIVKRATFEDSLLQFKDEGLLFDFIYLDGYAHLGQGDLDHFFDWFELLKVGGIYAGHDYDKSFPSNIENINSFFQKTSLPFFLTNEKVYPTWFTIKR